MHPIASAAVASDKHNMLAALVRRANESFLELLARLDQAIEPGSELRSMLTARA